MLFFFLLLLSFQRTNFNSGFSTSHQQTNLVSLLLHFRNSLVDFLWIFFLNSSILLHFETNKQTNTKIKLTSQRERKRKQKLWIRRRWWWKMNWKRMWWILFWAQKALHIRVKVYKPIELNRIELNLELNCIDNNEEKNVVRHSVIRFVWHDRYGFKFWFHNNCLDVFEPPSLCVSLSLSVPFDNCVRVFQIIYNSVLISPWNQIFIKKNNLLNWIVYTKTNDCLLQFSTAKADLTAMPAMSSVCFDLFLSFLRCCYFCCHSLRHCDTYVQMCVHLLFYNGVNNIKSSFMGGAYRNR